MHPNSEAGMTEEPPHPPGIYVDSEDPVSRSFAYTTSTLKGEPSSNCHPGTHPGLLSWPTPISTPSGAHPSEPQPQYLHDSEQQQNI